MLNWSTSNRGVPNPSTKRPPLCCLAMPLHSSILLDLLHRNEREEGNVWMREVDLSVPSSFSNLRRNLRRHFFLYIHLRSGFEGQDEVEVKDTLPFLAIYWPNFRYILFRYMVPDMPSGTWSHPVASVKVTHLHRTPRLTCIGLKPPSSFLYLSTQKQVALQLLNAVLPSVRKTCCCLLLRHSENWKSSSDPLGILLFQ